MNFGYRIDELDDSPKETFGKDGAKIGRRFLIPWDRRIDFAIRMTSQNYGYGAGPASYPPYPFAVVDSIENSPFSRKPLQQTITDPTSQVNAFGDQACLSVITYSTQKAQTSSPQEDQLPNGTYATYRRRSSGQYMVIEGRGLKWGDGKPVGQDKLASVLIPLTEHVVTWHHVSRPPWAAIDKLKGQVIADDWKIPGQPYVFKAETLLFDAEEDDTEYKVDQSQPQCWSMTYTFKEQRIAVLREGGSTDIYGWNHLFRPDTSQWEKPICVRDDDGQKNLYLTSPVSEFKKLFRFE